MKVLGGTFNYLSTKSKKVNENFMHHAIRSVDKL